MLLQQGWGSGKSNVSFLYFTNKTAPRLQPIARENVLESVN